MLKLGLVLAVLAVVACLAAAWRLHAGNTRLRTQIASARAQHESTARLRDDNAHLSELLTRAQRDEADARRAIHDEAALALDTIKALEKSAEQRRADKLAKDRATAEALATNRDPMQGPVLMEHCANVGRATPAAAFQTLLWAAVKGDDAAMGNLMSLTGASRGIVSALLATLPESTRKEYPTPEKLMAMMMSDAAMNVSAFQVLNQTMSDPTHATLTVAGLTNRKMDLSMQLAADGWQMVVSDEMTLKHLRGKLGLGGTVPPPKK